MHRLFCPICLIHLIGRKYFHFEETNDEMHLVGVVSVNGANSSVWFNIDLMNVEKISQLGKYRTTRKVLMLNSKGFLPFLLTGLCNILNATPDFGI